MLHNCWLSNGHQSISLFHINEQLRELRLFVCPIKSKRCAHFEMWNSFFCPSLHFSCVFVFCKREICKFSHIFTLTPTLEYEFKGIDACLLKMSRIAEPRSDHLIKLMCYTYTHKSSSTEWMDPQKEQYHWTLNAFIYYITMSVHFLSDVNRSISAQFYEPYAKCSSSILEYDHISFWICVCFSLLWMHIATCFVVTTTTMKKR